MADLTRTYTGFAARGRQTLPERTIPFERGVPVEVSADEAAVLDKTGDWTAPKNTSTPDTTPAVAATTKEP